MLNRYKKIYEQLSLNFDTEVLLEKKMTDLALDYFKNRKTGGLYFRDGDVKFIDCNSTHSLDIEFKNLGVGYLSPHVYISNEKPYPSIVYNGVMLNSVYKVTDELDKQTLFYATQNSQPIVQNGFYKLKISINELIQEIIFLKEHKFH
jgi:hypothetical protein